ncbi:ankyrin repeat domain-containing protein 13C isoform X2 [Prionailurus viverrinus]|uniref:Ankyrin repeat domain-containing protein n=3 Tax=Felinae TaxID=338152 RepID=A0ABI7ZLA0_FELCA|nr:ankyrin repeat domain-containing protein 13C isoform X2 [Felis catus]XP_026914679.1 ankyrin repeat domain-containing protein 13C isoform X2 [Acinonyx jubatus]XP_040326558.1 ankyrin repeat domain-containing protein 13C isoform X2 [Puma yagouaroundi]XP_043431194.1 ankyrin repeat domain-containing protein 13C isoform X2 [Prionailurus bengalensis]XP_045333777.1 ankyrin repeat domain-containing protein 13C isoform X2 [Leopardus geoffroyi]XP_047726959.1 ankyrin repeat domain-containing protein 13
MTGEKIRSLRRDHKPSKEEGDLLEPGDEEAAATLGGTFTGGRLGTGGGGKGGKACHKIFSNHHRRLQLKTAPASSNPPGVPALPLHGSSVTTTSQSPALLAGTNPIAVVADGGSCPAHYPVHECVFKGDVRRLSSLIRTHNIGQKDNHGNTPLHLAVMLGNKECAHLLLAHNAPVKVKNAQGWSPLAEAISYGDRQMITALLRKLKQQSRESVEEKRPRLLKALKELGDFYLELHWDFQSWVPLLSRILPSDACKIYKQGINIRLDTTLIDFTDMKCQRGDLSFIFNGDAAPSESFVVLDNEQKVYQRIHHEESEMETEEEVDILMSSDIYSATLSTKSISFTRAQTGWLFREDKTERVGNFLADFYLVNGLVLESRKRREHLSEEDILRNKAIMESLSKGGNIMEQNFEPVRRQSLTPPPQNTITWEEYISAENGKLLNVLEVIAPFKHFNKLREFVQMKLPPGFPVKLDIPVFPTITATVTFQEFRYDEFDGSIFTIPDDYKEDPSRFPDL